MVSPLLVTEAGDEAASAWDAFVDRVDGASIYHRWLWRRLIEAESGTKTYYLLARDGAGSVRGILPLARLKSRLFGDFLVSLPYFNYGGCLAVDAAADQALVDHAVRLAAHLGVDHVELRETAPRGDAWPVRTDKVNMILDLADTEEAQWKALGSKLRSQIRRPERENPTIRFGGVELVPDFYRVFSRNMRDLGTPVYGRRFFERITVAGGSGTEIAVAYLSGRPAAAGFVVRHGVTAEIPWASSLREWNRIGINMYMYWEILKRAIGRGDRHFDFGRSSIDAGTYRFKAQWGAKPRQLYWHYWLAPGRSMPALTPTNPKFSFAINMWRQLPVWTANVIGPRIVRYLP